MKESTKKCPKCGNYRLVCIATQNIKLCTNCFDSEGRPTKIKWHKEAGQDEYL